MPTLLQRTTGNIHWQVLPEWETVLLGTGGLRLPQWQASQQVHVVKQGPHRIVYRVELEDQTLYIKHYRGLRFWKMARHLVRSCTAQREWRKTERVRQCGIATIYPVAWGREICGGLVRDSYLISEAIADTCSLESYAKPILHQNSKVLPSFRHHLIESIARFIATIHHAGIVHDDFHAGNILVRQLCPSPNHGGSEFDRLDPVSFCLIDLPGVRFSKPLDWSASCKSLIMFGSVWWEQTSRTERWRFWRAYMAERPSLKTPDRYRVAKEFFLGCQSYSRRLQRRRDKRSLRSNKDFLIIRQADRVAHAVTGLEESELSRIANNPDSFVWEHLDRPVKLGHCSVVVEAEIPQSKSIQAERAIHIAYKRYRPRNVWKAIVEWFRPSRSLTSWYWGHALLARGIATARPLLVCVPRRFQRRQMSYLATQWIEGAENLHLWAWQLAKETETNRLQRAGRVAISLGRLIGRLHAWQFTHRDLKGSNLLVVERKDQVETYLIDIDAVRLHRRLSKRYQVNNLSRLAVSLEAHPWVTNSICCRFLKAYIRQFPETQAEWKPLWRAITLRSQRHIHRKQRRGETVL